MGKKIEIEIPDGKKAEWVNDVLTLVEESGKYPVTERIKTFKDALTELGDQHPLVEEYRRLTINGEPSTNISAYLKLRIIVAALNEGWEPKFTRYEIRYYPWITRYTQKEYNMLNKYDKCNSVFLDNYYTLIEFSRSVTLENNGPSNTATGIASCLTFRSKEVAIYAGRRFLQYWVDYMFR